MHTAIFVCLAALLPASLPLRPAPAYDPLSVAKPAPTWRDFTVADTKRGRDIPVRVYLPTNTKAAPVVLFSHGLGGSKNNNPYLSKHWAARGYVVVFMQHAGSDDTVWKNKPISEVRAAMQKAASSENFTLRTGDVATVLDTLTTWNADAKHALAGRLDLSHVGMSGHSFGAVTTQAVSGQRFAGASLTDKRIDAAVAMSPSGARQGGDKEAFGSVGIPWLLMTGTKDDAPIGNVTAKSRLSVFPALPPGDKYELVLKDAEHSAFGDGASRGDRGTRNPNHHTAILAISTAFWDATLRGDRAAKEWLSAGATQVLESGDTWQTK